MEGTVKIIELDIKLNKTKTHAEKTAHQSDACNNTARNRLETITVLGNQATTKRIKRAEDQVSNRLHHIMHHFPG